MSEIHPSEPISSPLVDQPDFAVPAALQAEIDELITHYPVKRSASLMLLHAVQEHFGYLSRQAVEWVAGKLGLQPINVYELVTFYPMFHAKPVGRYHLKVCRTLSCALGGSY
jgi:NADH-quinone oxidoreductase subunit E